MLYIGNMLLDVVSSKGVVSQTVIFSRSKSWHEVAGIGRDPSVVSRTQQCVTVRNCTYAKVVVSSGL